MFRISPHLQQNSQSGIYYFRLTVPERLRHIVGCREIKKSLRTGRRTVAIVLAQQMYAEVRTFFSKIEFKMGKRSEDDELVPYSSAWIKKNAPWGWGATGDYSFKKKKTQVEETIKYTPVEERLTQVSKVEDHNEEQASCFTEDNWGFEESLNSNVSESTTLRKISYDKDGNLMIDFGGDLEKELAAAKALGLASSGVKQQVASPTKKDSSEKRPTLAKMIRDFVNEKKRADNWTPKTISENEAIYQLLKEVLKNPVAETIGLNKAMEFKETMLKLPPNRSKGIYAGKTVKEVLAMQPQKTMAIASINKYLRRVSSLFRWGRKHGYVNENPFEELGISQSRRAHKERPRYTDDDIKLLLNSDASLKM